MINVHLSGDIVRCPDISAIKKRLNETRELHNICKYNRIETDCRAWQNSIENWQRVKQNNNCGRCMLSGSIACPGHNERKKQGNKAKTFNINHVVYRKIASSAHDLVKSSKTKTIFLTLTFPKFKIQPNEKLLNEAFSRFVENLRANYNCSGYVAVRERGKKRGRYHFHILCAIPFVSFITLNGAWCAAISNLCNFSKCAVRTTKETIFIKNPGRALRYVCKYFAKSKYQVSDTRIVFISNNLIKEPIKLFNQNVNDILIGYKGIYINHNEFTTSFRIINPAEFDRFCNEFLYSAFEKSFNYPLFSKKTTVFCSPGSG